MLRRTFCGRSVDRSVSQLVSGRSDAERVGLILYLWEFIMYLERACLIDHQSQLWIYKAIDQACDVTC